MIVLDEELMVQMRTHLIGSGLKVVTTNGCFDLLHMGHLHLLREAKRLGDVLIVLVNTDDTVRRIKGDDRPVKNVYQRMNLLDEFKSVDFVIPLRERWPTRLLSVLCPDVHVKDDSYRELPMPEKDTILQLGGEVRFIKRKELHSTTQMIERIRG